MTFSPPTTKIRIILMDLNKTVCDTWLKHLSDFNKTKFSTTKNLSWFDIPLEIIVHNGDFDQLASKVNLKPKPSFQHYNEKLMTSTSAALVSSIPQTYEQHMKVNQCTTTIVSPGNSIGYMGGGFDKALAELFSPTGNPTNWKDTELAVQSNLLDGYKGYLTPTNANLIEFKTDSFFQNSKAWNLLSANSILHIPTMRVPRRLYHGPEDTLDMYRFVFDSTWEVLSTLNKANLTTLHLGLNRYSFIDTLVLTGFGTGYGKIPIDVMCKAMISAITIFTNHSLKRVDKSIYCLKFLKEDYKKLVKQDEINTDVSQEPFDPLEDPIDQLYFTKH
ncbi:unnamed protein product [Ambrosiozyma monospora]|uniref:Unnamed protein product n=1 Tax=Ambrosiozyma monospora TaxID=43982 RepID=A0A9W6YZD1_AMBMO|nr:unnamed protein product [Ambrosiozyma monospora]